MLKIENLVDAKILEDIKNWNDEEFINKNKMEIVRTIKELERHGYTTQNILDLLQYNTIAMMMIVISNYEFESAREIFNCNAASLVNYNEKVNKNNYYLIDEYEEFGGRTFVYVTVAADSNHKFYYKNHQEA